VKIFSKIITCKIQANGECVKNKGDGQMDGHMISTFKCVSVRRRGQMDGLTNMFFARIEGIALVLKELQSS
jgi:hypothetical protein